MTPTQVFLDAAAEAIWIPSGPAPPGPATHFEVAAPTDATFDTPFDFEVTALDENEDIAVSYAGAINFTSTDLGAVLPSDGATLTSGIGTFEASLVTTGNQTITATDDTAPSINGTSGLIDVDF